MISIKGGTKTFSESTQESSFKRDTVKNVDAAAFKKHFGDQAVGDVLNKVADPNYIDPSKKARSVGNPQLDKDSFMKLLLTQMKHQDPTSPLKSHEMAAQLAQFSQLESLNNINESIKENGPSGSSGSAGNLDALKLIGMNVSGDSSKISRADLTDMHDVTFDLQADASQVVLKVKDQAGNVVRELQANNLKKGKNEINWNGEVNNGTKARPGQYSVTVEAKSSAGTKVTTGTKFSGAVTGVNFSPTGPVLMVGNKSIRMKDVKQIVSPNIKDNSSLGVKKVDAKAINADNNATDQNDTSGIDGVAMSREMVNKIKKQGVGTKAF